MTKVRRRRRRRIKEQGNRPPPPKQKDDFCKTLSPIEFGEGLNPQETDQGVHVVNLPSSYTSTTTSSSTIPSHHDQFTRLYPPDHY